MTLARLLKDAVRGPGAGWRIAGASALTLTVAAQIPGELLGRARRRDLLATIPNWRFFAPDPSVHDYELVYRTLSHQGETSGWKQVPLVRNRRAHQMLWYPERRAGKAVFDMGTEVLRVIDQGFATVRDQPSYRALTNFLRREIRQTENHEAVKGFQFALVRSAGYDLDERAEWQFISPYTSIAPVARPTAMQGR
ncbi:hypothetical protein ACFVIM_08725 [Streptomyces sp. NPDC057638]|uniref:hypothetical protein n=1 Tax=Streptomyces sp. NPDC057638 TaxID=3346190 RepID=UPI00367ABF13